MTNWPISSPVRTHVITSSKSPVHICRVRMEVKASTSVVGRLATVWAANYTILVLLPYENIK